MDSPLNPHPPTARLGEGAPHGGTLERRAARLPARLHADALFNGASEVEIQHREAVYRLRITSLGKLILTK